MRLALNLCSLRGQGSRQVGRGVLAALPRVAPDLRGTAWVPAEWEPIGADGIAVRTVRAGWVHKLFAENVPIRRALTHGMDALFSLGDTSVPRVHVPHLLMVQTAFLAYPRDEQDFPVPMQFRARNQLMDRYFALGLDTVTRITVQTEHMRSRLAHRWSLDPARIAVVPSAISLPEAAPGTRPRRGYLAYVAGPGWHKNHVVIADVLHALARRGEPHRVVVTVREHQVPELVTRARKHGVLDRIEFVGAVDAATATRIVAEAELVLAPSKLESFGLTYVEALALGTPVVAADRDFAREICGDAALYADADDGAALAERVLEAGARREQLAARGSERARAMETSWDDVARSYADLLREVARS